LAKSKAQVLLIETFVTSGLWFAATSNAGRQPLPEKELHEYANSQRIKTSNDNSSQLQPTQRLELK
jgi:hypothetical protein